MALTVNIIPVFVVLLFLVSSSAVAARQTQVPCFFIFGDSLLDNGNNNELTTLIKADYLPYGIDFRKGPTGRFNNGRNTADILAQLLGFDTYIPPFATAQGKRIIKGVNYASGAAGIRNETGQRLGDRISLDRQLLNHNLTISRIADLLGNCTKARHHLRKCLYYFAIGSNDYINNYFQPDYYPTSSLYTPQEYATVLVQQYSNQLKTLYKYGARKVSVSGLGPLGCIPGVLVPGTNGSACVESINDVVGLFNDNLKLLVDDLNNNLTDAKFVYINTMDLRPAALLSLGIKVVSEPCCKVSNITGLCIPGETPCPVRAHYAFYDNFHPTEIVHTIAATASYTDILKLISYDAIISGSHFGV